MVRKRLPPSKTKIICTIGPASQSQPVLERMMRNGMSIARVNLTHGDLERHARTIRNIRCAAVAVGQRVAIWGDLPGPKMRIGSLASDSVWLRADQSFVLQAGEFVGDAARASFVPTGLPQTVMPGDRVHLNDGLIQLEVQDVVGQEIHCRILDGGELCSHDGLNLPNSDLGSSAFTDRDRARLAFAAEQELDAISPSFIQDAADLNAVREAASALNYNPFLLAKIERAPAVRNLKAILASADAVVIARGDLGIETPIEEITLLQKRIIRAANLARKPAITATHMLESMTHHRLPTRAEVADVTNAVLDGTDCLTLSAETALGNHPAEVVDMMARTAQVAESHASQRLDAMGPEAGDAGHLNDDEASIWQSIKDRVEHLKPAAVLTPGTDRAAVQWLSHMRLPAWIVAFGCDEATCQALQFFYGVHPVHLATGPEGWEQAASDWLQRHGVGGGLLILSKGRTPLPIDSSTYVESEGSGGVSHGTGTW